MQSESDDVIFMCPTYVRVALQGRGEVDYSTDTCAHCRYTVTCQKSEMFSMPSVHGTMKTTVSPPECNMYEGIRYIRVLAMFLVEISTSRLGEGPR